MRIVNPITLAAFAFLVCVSPSILAQGKPDDAKSEIPRLIEAVQQAISTNSNAEQFFSPALRSQQKSKIDSLQAKGFLKFEISDYSIADLEMKDSQHASLPVTIKWSTRTQEASKSTTLYFVKDGGHWFLADADFWEVSIGWFAIPILAFAIAYGVIAVFTYLHASRQAWADGRKKVLWQTLAIVPFAPFFYFHRRPWSMPSTTALHEALSTRFPQ